MAYLYSDLITDFRNILRDPSTLNNKFFTDSEILTWLADGNMELVREAGLYIFSESLALTVFDGDVVDAMTAGSSYTTITVDAGTCTPPNWGTLSIENSGGNSQSFDFTSWSLASTTYTFTIPSTEASYSFAANDTVTIYKGEYAFPTNALKIVSVTDENHERILPTTINALDEFDRNWRSKTGDVSHWYPTHEKGTAVNNSDIGFFKLPTSAQSVRIVAWKLPTSSAAAASLSTTNAPEIEDAITKLALDYALAMGHRKKRDYVEYDRLMSKFEKINIPKAKRFFHREEDRVMALGSNEGQSGITVGRLPEWYPKLER